MINLSIPNATYFRESPTVVRLTVNQSFIPMLDSLDTELAKKKITQVAATLRPPFRPRTKGDRSQNARLWGNATDLSDQLSTIDRPYTKEEIKQAMCRMAVSEGYPTQLSIDGTEQPKPTEQASVEEMTIVLNVIQRFADEHGFYLTEYDEQNKPYRSIGGRSRGEMVVYWERIYAMQTV